MRLQHSLIGSIDFTSATKPQINVAGNMIRLVVDENLYLFTREGLKFIWMMYVPKDGEEVRVASVDDITVAETQ